MCVGPDNLKGHLTINAASAFTYSEMEANQNVLLAYYVFKNHTNNLG